MSKLPTRPIKTTRLVDSSICILTFGNLGNGMTFVGPFHDDDVIKYWVEELEISDYEVIYLMRPEVTVRNESYNPDLGE